MRAANPGKWDWVELAHITEESAFGPRFSSDAYSETGNVYTLRTTDISEDGRINYETMPRASLDEAKFENHFLRIGDIVITRSGRIGTTAVFSGYAEPVLPGAFLIRFRLNSESNPFFYRYWLNSSFGQQQLFSVARGAAQQNINITNVEKLSVVQPPRKVQDEIVAFLSSYDDLIDTNRRRIAFLEESARLLYKEWFVDLRFPGHESAKIMDGLPEGWVEVSYADCFSFIGGYPFKSSTYNEEGEYKIVTIANVQDGWFDPECRSHIASIPENMPDECKLCTGDIILSLTGNVGRTCIVFGDGYLLNQRVSKIIGNDVPASFIYWTFNNLENRRKLENLAYGVAQLNLSPKSLGKEKFICPSKTLIRIFNEIASVIFQQITMLNLHNVSLARARDLLLPKLMSGEIEV